MTWWSVHSGLMIAAPETSMTDKTLTSGALDLRLRAARERAQSMHAQTDALNTALARVQAALVDLKLGVSAQLLLHREELEYGESWSQWLHFEKNGSRWRLMAWSGPDHGDGDDWSGHYLLDTSRITRERAADKLPELIDALIEAVDKKAEEIAVRTAEVNALAEQIEALVEDGS